LKNSYEELKIMLQRERTVKRICAELNNFIDLKPTLVTVIDYLKELAHCETVGIRLEKDGDYPLYDYEGVPKSLIIGEDWLCMEENGGKKNPGKNEVSYELECMCGNVISGRFDPSKPFFTINGSFWTNNVSRLSFLPWKKRGGGEGEDQLNSIGYQSIALVPIRVKNKRIGLIQLGDKRAEVFSKELIEFIEMIGEQIGLAVQNSYIHNQLLEVMREIKTLRGILPICASCKKIRDDSGYWHQVEEYIKTHANVKLTHAICPECMEQLYPDVPQTD
jgi:hypothetical protein